MAAPVPVTTTVVPPPPPADTTKPSLSTLKLSPATFRAATRGAAARKGRRPPVGTTVRYTVSESATVTLSVAAHTSRRRVGTACRRPTTSDRRQRSCTTYKAAKGTIVRTGATGAQRFKSSGRIGGRNLKAGRYRLSVVAVDQAGDRARAFTYVRQRLGRAAPDPAIALENVLGVYSSHPSAPLALAARSAAMDARTFRATAAAGVRLPAMRGSIHLMPAAAGARAFRALPPPEAEGRNRLKGFGIAPDRYVELRALLSGAAEEPRTQKELAVELVLDPTEVKGATAQMTREGSLLRIGAEGLRSNLLRYQACELPAEDRDGALAWLAGEYLRTLGPARREDVIWWLGVTKGRADAALASLATVDVGDAFLLRAEDEEEFGRAREPRGVDLLGKWDPLTMGHAPGGRARCELPAEAYDVRGDGLPVVLSDGRAIGTWSLTAKGKRLLFVFDPFSGPPAPRLRAAIDAQAEALAALLA